MKNNIFFILIFVVGFTSCNKFLDVNQDLDSPSTSTPNYLLPPVLANMATSIYDHGETDAYFTQQVATMSGYHREKDRWDYLTAHRIPQWRRHYHDISVNALHVIQSAERENSTNYIGVAKIIYAFSTLTTTDMFGDMPFSEALEGNPAPKYDSQEFIYSEILKLLDEAIDILENTDLTTCRKMTSVEDNIYGGDITKWISFAYAIKARLKLHLTPNVNKSYSDIIQDTKKALSDWTDAKFKYKGGNGSALQLNLWGISKSKPNWDYRANILDKSAPSHFMLIEALKYDEENKIIKDPRQSLLMKPNESGDYLYVYPSEGKAATLKENDFPNLYDSYVTGDLSPMYFFTKEELYFILAESEFLSGDKSGAFDAFKNGITTNMERVGVTADTISDFISGETMPQNENDLTLSGIMMQKYVALWLQGEIWTDMRRYDYSEQIYTGLKKPRYSAYYWDRNNPKEWIERLPYDTETEEIYNKPELERLGAYQNPEWLKKPMFWAK